MNKNLELIHCIRCLRAHADLQNIGFLYAAFYCICLTNQYKQFREQIVVKKEINIESKLHNDS